MRRILHFGLGNFARAHLCDYTQEAGGWEITGVSLRSAAVRDGLASQGYDYDLCVMGQGARRITCLRNILVAPENPQAVVEAVARADLITATVTEKGYHLTAAGELDLSDPVIAAELRGEGLRSLIGYLAHGLARREAPVSVLSCDNRVGNGNVLEGAVRAFVAASGLVLDWGAVRFPNAMVDRITPATSDAVRRQSGDPMAVATEPFREWVIEDRTIGPRPDWPGVDWVADVAPHELRKLRMLNGAHSLLAYAGIASGHIYVHEAIADPKLRDLALRLMREAEKTVPPEGRVDSYADALVARFETPGLNHALRQIAMDGSQKVPYRFLGALRERDGQGDALRAGLRAWMAFCAAEVAEGRRPDDPKADQIVRAVQSGDPDAGLLAIVGATDLAS